VIEKPVKSLSNHNST